MLRHALGGAAIAAVLAAGYVSVGYAAPAGSSAGAGPTDTTPPPETTPAPDPAPPAPKPPAPKPPPKPAPKPAHVYHAPVVQHSTPPPASQPTYTPPAVTHHVTKKVVHHARKHKRAHKRKKHVVVAPKVAAQVKHATVVKISGVPTAAVATNGTDALRRSLVIAGIGLAALLFLLVVAVPSTAARFTAPGRMLMDHQTDLFLVGVAVLLVTALLFAFSGNG